MARRGSAGWAVLLCWWWGAAQGRVFSVDVASSRGGASLGVSCPPPRGCAWRGWSSFGPEGSEAAQLGVQDGLAMTVLHEATGDVLLRRTFSTWHAYTHALDLRWWLGRLRAGRVVVLVVRRGGTYGLGDALPTLTSLGSLLAGHAPPRALLAWVFVVGGCTLLETLAPLRPAYNDTLYAHAMLSAAPATPLFPPGLVPTEQERLCDSHAALGALCDPVTPWVSPRPVIQIEQGSEEAEVVGVVVCGGGRFQYLAHTLTRLVQNTGLTASQVVVAVDRAPAPEVLALLGLLGLRYRVVDVPQGVPSVNHRLFQYYRGAWTAGLLSFPRARYLAFLDEDVEVSPDWLSLLLHLAPALDADPSLWCVSGSGSSNPSLYRDPGHVVRGWRQPGWGFLLQAAEVWAAVESWPDTSDVSVLYDTFLLKTMARGRECVFPVLGRSRHYGVGVNTVPEIHHFYFLKIPLHDGSPAPLPPPEALTQQRYEEDLWARLRAAEPLNRNPCAPGFLRAPDNGTAKDLVFFFYMNNIGNSLEWTMLAECVGAWPYSTQGLHRGSVELPQAWGGSVWLVGVPASPYHVLKPSGVMVWNPMTPYQIRQQARHFSSLRPPPSLANRTVDAALSHLFRPSPTPEGTTA
ncbi:protein O-linked-mannose beta-1,2-N-acetylglucosaminyltransferase 1-like [Eriocheir sinensis]|uniref:protein O-linked-mannose beta-1,2-N-acetylglucosaminyltransferase 1-like n=1 Tax=Eriocheir sinensis TaxID=95602 RepID=UPI0021C850C7|nr:protein O-linked-mannose beta-1,2-N-acetylglucosaminyltransferase 1-like [Eriocheir sinensis]